VSKQASGSLGWYLLILLLKSTRASPPYSHHAWQYDLLAMGQVYVASISAMISLYMRNAQLDHMLNAQEASVIFSNAEEILSINTKLLGKLQAKGEPIAKLARVFLEVGPNPTPNPNLNPYLNPYLKPDPTPTPTPTRARTPTASSSRWAPSSTSTCATATATSLASRCCRRAGSRATRSTSGSSSSGARLRLITRYGVEW
jgi:hypothetical protein